ncbi:unnamed protein product [Rotaria magnacalcarata]
MEPTGDRRPVCNELNLTANGHDDNLLVETEARIRGMTVDCTTIDFRCCRLDDEAMELLCQALVNNKSITTLDLRSNQIGETGAQHLARGLHESTIHKLLLGHNRLGDKGLKHLAGFLASSITLEVLDLSDNDIGEIGMRLLPSLSYKGHCAALDLTGNHIGVAGIRFLGDSGISRSLRILALGNNSIGDDGIISIGSFLWRSELWLLDVQSNGITGKGAFEFTRCLTGNRSLLRLSLKHNCIQDEGAREITRAIENRQTPLYIDIVESASTEQTVVEDQPEHNEVTNEQAYSRLQNESNKENMEKLRRALLGGSPLTGVFDRRDFPWS